MEPQPVSKMFAYVSTINLRPVAIENYDQILSLEIIQKYLLLLL